MPPTDVFEDTAFLKCVGGILNISYLDMQIFHCVYSGENLSLLSAEIYTHPVSFCRSPFDLLITNLD